MWDSHTPTHTHPYISSITPRPTHSLTHGNPPSGTLQRQPFLSVLPFSSTSFLRPRASDTEREASRRPSHSPQGEGSSRGVWGGEESRCRLRKCHRSFTGRKAELSRGPDPGQLGSVWLDYVFGLLLSLRLVTERG